MKKNISISYTNVLHKLSYIHFVYEYFTVQLLMRNFPYLFSQMKLVWHSVFSLKWYLVDKL